MENNWLTHSEAAKYLGLTKGYLYKLTMQKKIPYYKPFGNRSYFKREDLDKVLKSNAVESNKETEHLTVLDLSNIPTYKLLEELSKRGFTGEITKKVESEKSAYSIKKEYVIKLNKRYEKDFD